jgi:serine/threonine protein phosphatase PrpC
MKIYAISLKGMRRQNEDKHNIILNLDNHDKIMKNINFFSIFDGHGGKEVSAYLCKELHKYFMNQNINYPISENRVNNIFSHVQKVLKLKYNKFSYNTGSTSLIAIQYEKNNSNYLNIINLGDSRCILCRDNFALPLTKDHKPMWPEENMRITKLGGKIYYDDDWRIMELSVSRSFGDISATPFLTHVPDLFRYKIEKNDKFIVLACDGLWDVLSNQEVVNYILMNCYDLSQNKRINDKKNISKLLGKLAISKGSGDNITAIVIFL